jgi:phosphoglycolate phosphatase-like HAD superfamily hydrolase
MSFLLGGKTQKINFAICTNKMESLAKKLLKEINLIEFFDYIAELILLNIESQIQDI